MNTGKTVWTGWFLFMVMAASFAVWTPPFMYPDEPTHLVGCLETWNPAAREKLEHSVLVEMDRHSFWRRAGVETPVEIPEKFYHAPMLRMIPTQFAKPVHVYAASGFLLRRLQIESVTGSLFALRVLGILMAGLFAWIYSIIIRTVLPADSEQSAAMSALAVPQLAYMAGAFNPSNTAWITGGMILLAALWLLDPGRRFHGFGLLFTALVLTVVTHRAALALVPAAGVAMIAGRRRISRHRVPVWVWPVAGIAVPALWVITAYRAPLILRAVIIRLATVIRQTGVTPVSSAADTAWLTEFIAFFWRSSILNFGWLSCEAPRGLYVIFAGIAGIGLLGGLRRLIPFGKRSGEPGNTARDVVLWTAVMGMIWAAAARYAAAGNLSQGRYLFAAWPAFACLITVGWRRWLPDRVFEVTVRWAVPVVWLISAWSLWWIWIPCIYF